MQPEDEKIDARDQRDGGWSWVQNDLYTFFLPIIGPQATHLYQVMTYLIPTRANNPIFDLSLRVIGSNAMMNKGTVSKYLGVLKRVGMIMEKPGDAGDRPMYLLGDLRKLAKLGEKEIRRRLGVRVVDSDDEGGGSEPPPEGGDGWPQGGPGSGDGPSNGSTPGQMETTAPEGSGNGGVHVADSQPDSSQTTLVDLVLSTKQGVAVQEKGGNCPQKGGLLSKNGDPFKVLNLSRKSLTTPLPPASGGSEISPIATGAEANGESKNLSDEGQEQNGGERATAIAAELASVSAAAKLEGQLVWATARVMRAHSFAADRRIEEAIAEALGMWCSKTGRPVDEAVALEAANFRTYQEHGGLMSYGWGWRWWFKRGFWSKPELWPFDRKKQERMRDASVGMNPYPADREGGP
jgi:hypothetical protein